MADKFIEITNEKTSEKVSDTKGRRLEIKNSTFNLEDGSYKGTIIKAYWYKTANEKEMVRIIIKLEDGTKFLTNVNGDWIEDYPFSQLISQTNAERVEDFQGSNVRFEVRNKKGDTLTFTNIRKISLDE